MSKKKMITLLEGFIWTGYIALFSMRIITMITVEKQLNYPDLAFIGALVLLLIFLKPILKKLNIKTNTSEEFQIFKNDFSRLLVWIIFIILVIEKIFKIYESKLSPFITNGDWMIISALWILFGLLALDLINRKQKTD